MVLPEIVAVGIYNSQHVARNTAVSKNRKTSMFELELPMEAGGVSFIGDTSMPITPNMLICAKPGQLRHTKFPYKCYFLHMILHSGTLYDTLMQLPDFFETEKLEHYKALFAKLIHYDQAGGDNSMMLQSIMLELVHTIRQDVTGLKKWGAEKTSSSQRIEKAIAYIKANLTEELSLERVADYVSVSPIHFHNSFRTAVGMTLREYVEHQRIKKAIHLLLTTDHTLTQIAFACGFSSQSYFSYVFKRKMGKTPREYIQEVYSKYEL